MSMFLYYAAHTFKNQIKKLFKTWVLIFILVCFVCGGVIGGIIGLVSGKMEEAGEEEPVAEETVPEDEIVLFEEDFDPLPIEARDMVELVAGLVVVAVILIMLLGADKNGARIFLPADVDLLFASPMKPQSVLLFRLATQMGVSLLVSLYMLFQLPNLILNLGLSGWAAAAFVAAWALVLMLGKLLQVLAYLLGAEHPGFKRGLRTGVYAVLALAAGGFALYCRTAGLGFFGSVTAFFNAPVTRFVPVWGWLKGLCVFSMDGRTLPAVACIAACVLFGVLLWVVISHVKADFYEDAMQKSEELAEAMARARSGGKMLKTRKKDRSDRLRRDMLRHGCGANVYFFKTLYNRFRFAHLGYFTRTAEFYLVLGAGLALFTRYAIESDLLIVPALAIMGAAFFRSLRDSLQEDTGMDWFVLIPEPMFKKLFWSLFGGTVNCMLDALPGMLAAVLILGASPLAGLAWLLAIASLQMFSAAVNTFIAVSVNVSAGKTLKQLIQVMFVYFGLIPDAAIIAIGGGLGFLAPAIAVAAVFNVGAALLFLLFASLVLEP